MKTYKQLQENITKALAKFGNIGLRKIKTKGFFQNGVYKRKCRDLTQITAFSTNQI